MNSPTADDLVSVIIPCHNQGRFLADAVRSVLAQSYRPIEIIVVDDGSNDDTSEVARSFGDRVTLIQIPNSGPAAARNAGLDAASGGIVQFLDADDLLERRKIETHVRYLEAHPEIGLVYGDARCFTTEQPDLRWYKRTPGGGDGPWIEAIALEEGTWLRKLVLAPIFHSCCPVIRMHVVRTIGKLDETLRASEDWEYWIRIAAANTGIAFASGPESLALVRYTGTGLTSDQRRMRTGHLGMRRRIASYLPDALKPLNFECGRWAVRRYCRRLERPFEILRLLMANRGRALWRHLLRNAIYAVGESRMGYCVRAGLRVVLPYYLRQRVRQALGLAVIQKDRVP